MTSIGVLATVTSPEGRSAQVLAALWDLERAATDEPGTTLFASHRGSEAMVEFRAALVELEVRPTLVFRRPI